MLQQMSEATLTLLLTVLALGAITRFIPAARRGRRGKKVRSVAVWAGIGLGMVSSLTLTVINVQAPKSVDRQTVGLFTLPVAIVLTVLFLAFITVHSRRVCSLLPDSADDEARAASSADTTMSGDTLMRIVGALYIAATLFRAVPTVMNQAVVVLSDGAEIYSAPVVLTLVDYVLVWVLVCFVTWASYRLCSWNNHVWPAASTLIALLASHALMAVCILEAERQISIPKDVWNAMSWLINHEAVFAIAAGLALCAVVVLTWLASRSIPTAGTSPTEGRLGRAHSHLYKSMADTTTLGYLYDVLLIIVGVAYGNQEIELSAPESFSVVDDQMGANLADISDGRLHRFEYTTSGGVKVRFIVIQKSGSSFGVDLNVCDIYGPAGYYEEDSKAICKLCEVAVNITTIGFKGGYNPVPIGYKISNGTLTVPISALEASVSVFAK